MQRARKARGAAGPPIRRSGRHPYPDRVISLAVPQVDVINDSLDWATFIVGTISGIAAIIAIVVAIGAVKSIARERRRQFELQIPGQVLADVEETDLFDDIEFKPGKLRRYQRRLQVVTDPMPYWVRVMSADWYATCSPGNGRGSWRSAPSARTQSNSWRWTRAAPS